MEYLVYMPLVFAIWLVGLVLYGYRQFCQQWKVKSKGSRAPPSFAQYLAHEWRVTMHRTSRETGSFAIGGIIILGISMVFLAIGFIFLPISTTATQSLIDYSYSSNTSITDATYTGYTSVLGITPLLILVGFLMAAVVTGMLGIKVMKGSASASANPGSLMMIGLSIIFIAIGLIIEPVALDGISSVVHNSGAGISSTFTGYSAIVLISPMLVHIGFLMSAVFAGFFGIKRLSSAG